MRGGERWLIINRYGKNDKAIVNETGGIEMTDELELVKGTAEQKGEIIKAIVDQEFYPAIVEEPTQLTEYTKLPLSRLPALGVAFEPLAAAFQYALSGGQAVSGIYKVTVPPGMHLAEFNSGVGNLGSALNANNQVAGQSILNPLVCNPTMLFMAVSMANIDKKLDAIMEIQQELLDFLVQKDRSELKGDLSFLSDIMNNYKYNWNNEKYKNSNHIKVLDIKQAAVAKVDFYKEQITNRIKKKSYFHSDQEVKKQLGKIQTEFKDYQLALYLYGFSSFLEVMLLENYDSAYLEGITKKIDDYSAKYRDLYTKCYEQIEGNAKSSIQSNLLKGLANFNYIAGVAMEKVPGIGKTQLDETLVMAGEKLGEFGSRRIVETMAQLIEKQGCCVRPFIENICAVNRLYNQPMELLFDKENIYIGAM
jgi:hypothetical protein